MTSRIPPFHRELTHCVWVYGCGCGCVCAGVCVSTWCLISVTSPQQTACSDVKLSQPVKGCVSMWEGLSLSLSSEDTMGIGRSWDILLINRNKEGSLENNTEKTRGGQDQTGEVRRGEARGRNSTIHGHQVTGGNHSLADQTKLLTQ